MSSKKEKREISSSGTMELARAVGYIEELLANLRRGVLLVQDGDRSLELRPTSTVGLEVEAKQKDSKESFELKLSWRKERAKASEEAGQPAIEAVG